MVCTECKSNNRRELKTEMMIHHAGFLMAEPMSLYPSGLGVPGMRILYL